MVLHNQKRKNNQSDIMDIYFIFKDYLRNHFAYAIETNAKNI